MATSAAPLETLDQKRLLKVLTDYRRGDFSVRLPVDRTGLPGKIYDALNDVIERNEKLVKELERLSNVVGKAGNIKQRASLPSAEGQWATAIDSVNTLVSDLVQPTTEVARVIGAVAKGDLSQSMALEIDGRPLTGEFLRTAKVVNTMVDQLGTFASEVTRVAREVGTEGKLGGQAIVKGVAGTWKDLTDNVNFMAANLTSQVRNIAEVTTAVARGDLSKKITVDVKGEILELKNTVNTMVDQLSSFASEVTRVAREVGTEGKLGGQAEVKGVAGTWKDLTDNVNQLAGNLTVQLRDVSRVATAIASGDLSKKITVDARGEILQIKDVINTMVDQLGSFASEVSRVAREVGTEGKLGGQAEVRGVAGTWKDLTDNVNTLAGNLTSQVRNIAEVTTAVARGDLSKKITVDVRGEILELKNTINTMVDQLSSFASEVTRVAKEVGTEGKLGGQAEVKGVAGTWRDLTDNVNQLAGNLTVQLRDVSQVSTAIANGDLTQKITVEAAGRNPADQGRHQHDGRPAERVRVGSHAGRARGRHRRKARRPGGRPRRRRHLARPHRLGQLHGRQPHRAGPEHRRRHHRGRQGRSLTEDHGRRSRRNPGAEEHHQHDGRSAQRVRVRSHARRARGRFGREARRPGGRAGRRRHLEGPHRQRQLHGRQPDRAGPEHRRGHHRGRQRRPVEEDHGRRARRDPRAEEHDQRHGRSAERLRVGSHARGARGRHRGQARRPGRGQGRGRHLEGPHRQRQPAGRQPDRAAARRVTRVDGHRQRRPDPEDHRRGPRRDPADQGRDQQDGRPARVVRVGSHARREGGRHGRQAGRPGRRAAAWPAPGRT